MRIRFPAAAALLAAFVSQAAFADSPLEQTLRHSIAKPLAAMPAEAVVVVLQLNPAKGATREEAEAHVEELVAFLRKQPGYIDGQFLRNINPANSPRFVHLTRWKAFDDWERLFANPDFVSEVARQSPFISGEGLAFVQVR